MRTLQIIGSVVDFEGETVFSENRVVEFGALQLLSFAQIRFTSGSSMKFVRNIGKYVIAGLFPRQLPVFQYT